jgi:hypothetical protein
MACKRAARFGVSPGEDPVAQVLGDETAIALDQLRAAAMIGGRDPPSPRGRAWPTAPWSPQDRRTLL